MNSTGDAEAEDLSDPRVKAGILLATAGQGGDDLTPFAFENFPWLRNPSFAELTTPALVVSGDHDTLPLTGRLHHEEAGDRDAVKS